MRKYSAIILFSFIFIVANHVNAFVIPEPNPLIVETVVFETSSPIYAENRTSMRSGGSSIVINPSSTPFYLSQDNSNFYGHYCKNTSNTYPPELLKAGYATSSTGGKNDRPLIFYKLQKGQTYAWLCGDSDSEKKGYWATTSLKLSVYDLVDDKASYCVIPGLNVDGCGFSHLLPIASLSNVRLPDPKSFTLKGYMNGAEVLVKGSILFKFNPDFNFEYWRNHNQDQVKQKEHQEYVKTRNHFLALFSQGASLVILFGILFVIRKKNNKQNNPLVEKDDTKMENLEVLEISHTPSTVINLSKFLKGVFFAQIVVFTLLLVQIIFFASANLISSNNQFGVAGDLLHRHWMFIVILTLRDVVDQNLILLLPVLFLVGVIGNYLHKKWAGEKLKNLSYTNIISFFTIVFWIIAILFISTFGIGAGKPVIYLYPQNKMPVSVTLKLQGEITDTYPTIDSHNSWNVTAYPNGLLTNSADGREYSYLFWEGIFSKPVQLPNQGFVVAGKDTKDFLQTMLTEIGLTPKEYNEFIVYWLPKMQHNPYNHIYFAANDYTDRAVLDIVPRPDSTLRVFMMYRSLDKPIEVEKQSFKPFNRSGFTVVEWGGEEVR